jgi:uroporphyrinogen-III synthase
LFMDLNSRADLQGLKVISFESRRAVEIAELIRRYGGEPFVAPSMREIPLDENRAALELVPQLERGEIDLLILMTGVGTRTLNQVLLTQFSQERIIAAMQRVKLVVRGPKPAAALKELTVVPAISVPEPNTWREVLSALVAAVDLRGKRIVVQEYGIPNPELTSALAAQGATVSTVPIYRWELPEDLEPLRQAIEKITQGDAEIVLFTNGAQVDHLFRVAAESNNANSLLEGLGRAVVGSVGPICTEVLDRFGIDPDIEPAHPKMGSLLAEVAASAQPLLEAKRRPSLIYCYLPALDCSEQLPLGKKHRFTTVLPHTMSLTRPY